MFIPHNPHPCSPQPSSLFPTTLIHIRPFSPHKRGKRKWREKIKRKRKKNEIRVLPRDKKKEENSLLGSSSANWGSHASNHGAQRIKAMRDQLTLFMSVIVKEMISPSTPFCSFRMSITLFHGFRPGHGKGRHGFGLFVRLFVQFF